MTFEQTLLLFGYIAIMFLGLVVPSILMFSQVREERKSEERKSNKEHQQYIDIIKPGDVFAWDDRAKRIYRDPFDETDLHDVLLTTIVDIKTNEAGIKWVKYYYTHSGPDGMRFTDKLDDYLKYRYKIQETE